MMNANAAPSHSSNYHKIGSRQGYQESKINNLNLKEQRKPSDKRNAPVKGKHPPST